jgi:antitoxin VapB
MALNIKNPEVDKLAGEIARLTGESKTEAIRKALEERRQRLSFAVVRRDRLADLNQFLEREIWPQVPEQILGRSIGRKELDNILGYGAEGV